MHKGEMSENLQYLFHNWKAWDAKSLLFCFIRLPALVLQPIVTAYIPKAILDGIQNGVTMGEMTLTVALLSLLLALTIWMDPFMKELIRGSARIIRMRYAVMAFRKTLHTDYYRLESLAGRQMQKQAEAFYNARFSSGADFMEVCNNLSVCIVGVLASSVLLYRISVWMILLVLLTCAGEFFLLRRLNKKQTESVGSVTRLADRLDYFYRLSKDGAAAKELRIYGFGDYFIKAVADIVAKTEWVIAKYTHQTAAVSGTRALLNLVRQSIAYVYLVYLVAEGRLLVSDFIFYFGILTGFSNWTVNLVASYAKLERCCRDCATFRAYVESETKNEKPPNAVPVRIESIAFQSVSFTYPEAKAPTIRDMSFEVHAGENIAIVGENGAGKTTAIKLLCALYAPTSGEVLVSGKPLSTVSQKSCFDLYSVVFQDYRFLPVSIAENVALCEEDKIDRDRLWDCLAKAGIREKIESLPERENSMMDKSVYKTAVDFSGGEKQKLLLARALYKDAPILILDEPTAALDPIAENELYLQYSALSAHKTSFFISHRLSSTRFCDKILFLSDGKIAEFGTHEELMQKRGKYYRMYELQSYYYREEADAI